MAGALALAAAGAIFLAARTAPTAGATTRVPTGTAARAPNRYEDRAVAYYVAIGASESVGVQPVPWDRHGVRTDEGYANDLTRMERTRWPGLQLVDFGCPGITAQGALDGTGGCRYPAGSEVATAVEFVRDHSAEVVLVTVDLGFNDLRPCLAHRLVDARCVDTGIRRVAAALSTILAELRVAGGARLSVVGLQHGDPYVADERFGAAGFARSTVAVFGRLNGVLDSVYTEAGALVARVPDARGTAGRAAVVETCANTWMCTDHNIHPTSAGYRAIADAVAAAVTRADGG